MRGSRLARHWSSFCRRGAIGVLDHHASPDVLDGHFPNGHLTLRRDAPPYADREGSAGEGAIAKDSNAAQFKWLPVATYGSGPIGYCGLVNVKSSRGGYVGFRRFFAMIAKGPKGDYIKGRIEHIEGIPVSSAGSSTEDEAIETALTQDNCKEWGYTDFTGAS